MVRPEAKILRTAEERNEWFHQAADYCNSQISPLILSWNVQQTVMLPIRVEPVFTSSEVRVVIFTQAQAEELVRARKDT